MTAKDRAVQIIMRQGIKECDAAYYVDLAAERIAFYKKMPVNDCYCRYVFKIADIASLLYQRDKSIVNTAETLGYQSQSFSEGGVSVSQSGMTGSDISDKYESRILDILHNLDDSEGRVIFI